MTHHHSEAFMTPDDKAKFWRVLAVIIGVCLLWLWLASPARAAQDDGGSMYRGGASLHVERAAAARSVRRTHRKRTKIAKAEKHKHRSVQRSVSLEGVVSPLANKARQIVTDCNSTIVSARSRRGNRSNHPIGRAVDISGNPRCIYEHLKGWPGGYSIDYARAPGGPHVHISYNPGGQEWGIRFAHRDPFRVRRHHVAMVRP